MEAEADPADRRNRRRRCCPPRHSADPAWCRPARRRRGASGGREPRRRRREPGSPHHAAVQLQPFLSRPCGPGPGFVWRLPARTRRRARQRSRRAEPRGRLQSEPVVWREQSEPLVWRKLLRRLRAGQQRGQLWLAGSGEPGRHERRDAWRRWDARRRRPRGRQAMKRGMIGAMVIAAICGTAAAQSAQRSFASAKEAADALVAALGANDPAQLDVLFGPAYAKFEPTDQVAAAADRQQLAAAAKESLFLREDGTDRVTLILGAQAWPFPIPIVQQSGSWRFDTEAGIQELMNRIVGRHELAAIDLARNYVTAQADYASKDRDGDQVLEYAQRLGSTPG